MEGEADRSASKRRKLNNGTSSQDKGDVGGAAFLDTTWAGTPIEGVSFAVPQRKKLSLHISPARNEGVKAVNPTTSAAEFGLSWKQTGKWALSWEASTKLTVPNQAMSFVYLFQRRRRLPRTSA